MLNLREVPALREPFCRRRPWQAILEEFNDLRQKKAKYGDFNGHIYFFILT